MAPIPTTIVIPTVGRPSLITLLEALRQDGGPQPTAIVVVDDRRVGVPLSLTESAIVIRSNGIGPAGARNLGWHLARTPWVSFLDDDVLPHPGWLSRLFTDITDAPADVVGIQGRVHVPLPTDRRPTDFERSTAGLENAQWITADMTYRRDVLRSVGGFDERFKRAYREDADLGLRITERHGRIIAGHRTVAHPVRDESPYVSIRQQRGNEDDVLMRGLHGPGWRERVGAGHGRFRMHAVTVAAATATIALLARRRPSREALVPAAAWLAGTAEFTATRIANGPADPREIARMCVTSVAIPFAAVYWRLRGIVRYRKTRRRHSGPALVLFDRDGTLVHDVPYNGDPALVQPMPGAIAALGELRRAGVSTGVVTNQSAVARKYITEEQLASVNMRVEELLGPFDVWQVCGHGPDDGCECRKPKPAMVLRACASLDLPPRDCIVIGDIGADVEAAESAGATGILVPNAVTRAQEIKEARNVAPSLLSAVRAAMGTAR